MKMIHILMATSEQCKDFPVNAFSDKAKAEAALVKVRAWVESVRSHDEGAGSKVLDNEWWKKRDALLREIPWPGLPVYVTDYYLRSVLLMEGE